MKRNITQRINNVSFGFYTSEEVEKISVVEVKTSDKDILGNALPNGLQDPKMGVTEKFSA